MEAELASLLNVCSFAGIIPFVQEAVEENKDDDDDINYSPNPDTPPDEENIEPTIDKHVVTPATAPSRRWIRRGLKYYSVSRKGSMRSRSKPYHDSSLNMYAKIPQRQQTLGYQTCKWRSYVPFLSRYAHFVDT